MAIGASHPGLGQRILRALSPLWLPHATRRYRRALAEELRKRLRDARSAGEACPALDPKNLSLLQESTRHPALPFLAEKARVLLLSETGAGKSTLLMEACLSLALRSQGPLPIWGSMATYRGPDPIAFLQEKMRPFAASALVQLLDRLLASGQVALFLDDADAARDADKAFIEQWEAFLSGHPRLRVLITARQPFAMNVPSLEIASVAPFDTPALESWAACIGLTGAKEPETARPQPNESIAFFMREVLRSKRAAGGTAQLLSRSSVLSGALEPLNLRADDHSRLSGLAVSMGASQAVPLASVSPLFEGAWKGLPWPHDGEGLALLVHPDGSPEWVGFSSPWWQAYFRACALKENWLALDAEQWTALVQDTVSWRAVAVLAGLLEPSATLELTRRILATAQGDDSILLAIACAAMNEGSVQAAEEAIGALLRHLDKRDYGAGWLNAPLLWDIAGAPAIALLRQAIEKATALQQAQLWALLGQVGGPQAAHELAAVGLQADNELVNMRVARALERMGGLGALALAARLDDPNDVVRARAGDILVHIGKPAIGALASSLTGPNDAVRRPAAGVLSRIGAFAVPILLAAVRHQNEAVREAAVAAMRQLADPSAEPYLIEGFRDPSSAVRREALAALGRIAGDRALPYLREGLRDPAAQVRLASLDALSETGARALAPHIVKLLRDPEPEVRRRTSSILRQAGASTVEPLLLEFQKDNWDVESIYSNTLAGIGLEAIAPLSSLLSDPRWQIRRTAAKALQWIRHPEAIAPLAQALRDRDVRVREAAVTALGRLRMAAALPTIISSLIDRSRQVRRAAIRALGAIGDAGAVRPLAAMLYERDGVLRAEAVEALAAVGKPAVPSLLGALREPNWRVRQAAIEALKLIAAPEAVPSLLEVLGDRDWRIRQAAAEALGEIKDERAAAPLIGLLGDARDGPRWAAVEALAKIGAPSVPSLMQAISSPNWRVRWAAAAALGRIGEPALPALLRALTSRDDDTRWAAESALAQIGDPAVPLLTRVLRSRRPHLRQAAIEALSQINTPRAREALQEHWAGSWSSEQ